MKKTLLTLAMCAASLAGTSFAADDNPFKVFQDELQLDWIVTGEGTYTQCLKALEEAGATESGYDFIRFGVAEGAVAKVTFTSNDDVHTPFANTLEFANAIFEFHDMMTLLPNEQSDFGPGMIAGYIVDFGVDGPIVAPGSLTISVFESAVEGWLQQQAHLDDMASWPLVDQAAKIQPMEKADVKFQLVDADGQATVAQGEVYKFQGHEYTNKGIVWNEGELAANQFALLYKPGPLTEDQQWGGAQFRVLALGESYIPVPEPATGTLSLLALAGLAARRRRK